MKRKLVFLVAMIMLVFIAGCNGSSSDDTGAEPGPSNPTGIFTDAPVQGLAYSAVPSGLSGFTNSKGEFEYQEGDNVTFRVGNLVLGSVRATAFVTPFDIASYDDAVDIARLLQSVGTVTGGLIVLDSQRSQAVNNVVTDNMTLREALDALEDEEIITETAEDALEHMKDKSIYGGYAGYSAIRCESEGYKSVSSIMIVDKGNTFAFNIYNEYEDIDLPDGFSSVMDIVSRIKKIKIYEGVRTSESSFNFTEISDGSNLIYNVSSVGTEVLNTVISSDNNTCSGTGLLVRQADAVSDNVSCSFDNETLSEISVDIAKSNVYEYYTPVGVPYRAELDIAADGCSLTADAVFLGDNETYSTVTLYEKSFKGYYDPDKKSIFLSESKNDGSYAAMIIKIDDLGDYRAADKSSPSAIRDYFSGYYFEYAEDNATQEPLWSLFNVGRSYK